MKHNNRKYGLLLLSIIFVIYNVNIVSGQDAVSTIYNQIYQHVGSMQCVRLLNTTSYVGCSTPRSGIDGVLYYLSEAGDYDKISEHEIFHDIALIIVMEAKDLTRDLVNKMAGNSEIVGALVFAGHRTQAQPFSEDAKFPNSPSSSAPYYDWNPNGNNLLLEKLPFPIFLLYDIENHPIRQRAKENMDKTKYPLWATELTSFMYATDNSQVCLRRKTCLPLGGYSVWTSLAGALPFPTEDSARLILSLTSIDSAGLWVDRSIGAESDMSNLVAQLAALSTLGSMKDLDKLPKKIVFGFLNGESWGYLGSKKLLSDLRDFKCLKWSDDKTSCLDPQRGGIEFSRIALDHVDAIVEVKQVGAIQPGGNALYVHQPNHDPNAAPAKAALDVSKNIENLTVQMGSRDLTSLPPSSSLSFLDADSSLKSKTIVITDHYKQYVNQFYHSSFDDWTNVDASLVCQASTVLSRSLLVLAGYSGGINDVQVNCTYVTELLDCFTRNASCALALQYFPSMRPDTDPETAYPNHYTSVFQNGAVSMHVKFIHDMVAYTNHINDVLSPCTNDGNCTAGAQCIRSVCVSSPTYYHEARSTGIEYDGTLGHYKIVNPDEPNWTEPFWGPLGLRMYLVDENSTQIGFLIGGIIEFILACGIIVLIKRYYANHFNLL
eukprot:TRINITY_DN2062_c0_g1_i1.p1 TRINITY_DN2062_c0_g1~~TRINITY_DN2062_c0_g1_i1.p1  ORF type:complete len:661 (-),score=146.14 TRINITY_DN2062_c0_g1_i1:16-1998(-)